MTDFVAVIRRAVDGLKDNNPDMRAKVYEKARSAVLKQLENMKPRPTDDVIARQMAKLDAAVLSVENEHASALPADTEFPSQESFEQERKEPAAPPTREPEKAAPRFDDYVAKSSSAPLPDVTVRQAPEPAVTAQTPAPLSWNQPLTSAKPPQPADVLWMPEEADLSRNSSPTIPSPGREPFVGQTGTVASPSMPEAVADIPWDVSPFEDDVPKKQSAKTQDRAADSGKRPEAGQASNEWDELSALSSIELPIPTSAKSAPRNDKSNSSDVEKIVSKLEGKSFRAQPKGTKINYTGLIAGVAGLIIVGVGGYGVWLYRDSIMSMVNSTPAPATIENASTGASSGTDTTQPSAETAPSKPKETQVAAVSPKEGAASSKYTQRLLPDGSETNESLNNLPKSDGKEGKSVAEQTVKSKEVAAATPLAADGTAPAATNASDAAPAATDAPAATTEPAAQNTDVASTDPNAAPANAQKMFLYEERIGQASPTGITGNVTWSVANDTTATGGKPQSEIQAKVTVPERGMSALITFKRNTDKSLPASHVVELVFSLPKDFDGGGIDSVQRISMKQKEQDRGNSLIAVPAKITDDFHMIALNDDPTAVSANVDLLKNRSWIDIPITYRNGRRALITIEKGPEGTADFNKVLAEWAALSPA